MLGIKDIISKYYAKILEPDISAEQFTGMPKEIDARLTRRSTNTDTELQV